MPVQALSEVSAQRVQPIAGESCRVHAVAADGCRLDDGRLARPASSCLLQPLAGDRVLVADCGDALFILHVLSRAAGQVADLAVADAQRLRIGHARLELNATEHLALRSLRDMELQALTGSLAMSARNLLVSAIDSLIEQVRHRISSAQDICLRASGLLKLHGGNSFITAERDVRIDGERINVG